MSLQAAQDELRRLQGDEAARAARAKIVSEIRDAADTFAGAVRDLEIGHRDAWLGYMLEAVEAELGESALQVIASAIRERLRAGSW